MSVESTVQPDQAETIGHNNGDHLEISERLDKAAELISSASRWSVAATLVPVPYLDLAALASVQTALVVNLCGLYEQKVTKESVSGVVSVLLGTLVPASASQVITGSLLKYLPGYGSIIGGLSLATLGAASTYAVGKIFVRHLESGGTLDTFSVEEVKADLKKAFATASNKKQ